MNERFKKWCTFVLGVLTIYGLAFKMIPYINQHSNNEVVRFVNENELDTGSLFYTDSEMGIHATLDLVQKIKSQSRGE